MTALHEAAHCSVALDAGGRCEGAEVHADGSGHSSAWMPPDADHLSVAAFRIAGTCAATIAAVVRACLENWSFVRMLARELYLAGRVDANRVGDLWKRWAERRREPAPAGQKMRADDSARRDEAHLSGVLDNLARLYGATPGCVIGIAECPRRRASEMKNVDLPNQTECEAIWSIQIARYGRKPAAYDLKMLAKASDGMTGAEIEQAFIDELYAEFSDGNEPGMLTISQCLSETVPLSRLMAEQIDALRRWSQGRARYATRQPSTARPARKLAA